MATKTKKRRPRKRLSTSRNKARGGLIGSLNRALEDASRQALKEALSSLPGSTLVGKFLDQVAASPYLDLLRSLSLEEFASSLRRVAQSRGTVKTTRQNEQKSRKKKGGGKSYNTRTGKGRARIDTLIQRFLETKGGEASAEAIRASVGGTAAQVRESLSRLQQKKLVQKTGQRRGTRYTWNG